MTKKIWSLIGSVQFVIPLLIVITFVSLVGVVVPQGTMQPDFDQKGLRDVLIVHCGLNHVFSTWWFYALLGLLSINVVACSMSHQLKSVRGALRPHFLKSESETDSLKCSTRFTIDRDHNDLALTAAAFFKKRLFFVAEQKTDNGVQITARSFFFKEIGSLFFHFSILFFLAGGIVGTMQGFSLVKEFQKGEVASFPQWPYLLRCDWFKVEKNSAGEISAYKSKMTVLSADSAELFSKVVAVNHPLSYKGLSFYQNSWGEQPDLIEEAVVRVTGAGIDSAGMVLTVPLNAAIILPGSELTLIIRKFVCDFVIRTDTREVSSRSNKPDNPAIKVELYKGKLSLYDTWSFLNYPDLPHESAKDYKVVFLDYKPQYYTGIKVSKSPGNVFIWLGFALMTVGILLVFYFPQTSFWIFIDSNGAHSSRIAAGGASSRLLSAFQDEFKHSVDALQRRLRKGPMS